MDVKSLEENAKKMRRLCMDLAYISAGEGAHVGPALSIMDIVTVLFMDVMNMDSKDPENPGRDRFILSKGHGVLGLYVPLIMKGYITEEEGKTFNQKKTRLAGHPSGRDVNGIDHPAGSLGHGLSVACGWAMGARLMDSAYNVYTLVGDGELNEGSIWEALMFAAKYKLGNLTLIVDKNGMQYGGTTKELMNIPDLSGMIQSLGWNVRNVNGHDIAALKEALDKKNLKQDTPTCIIADTIKGHGFSKSEGNNEWHHVRLSKEDYELALKELG